MLLPGKSSAGKQNSFAVTVCELEVVVPVLRNIVGITHRTNMAAMLPSTAVGIGILM